MSWWSLEHLPHYNLTEAVELTAFAASVGRFSGGCGSKQRE